MKEKPKRRDTPILSREVIGRIIANGTFTLFLLLTFLSHGYFRGLYVSREEHLCAFFALFIFSGLMNCLCARSERLFIFAGILKNNLFILIMLLISAIQLLIIYFGGSLFRCTPLSLTGLLCAVLCSFSVLAFDCFMRIFKKLK